MPVNTDAISQTAKQTLKSASQNARNANTIDEALEIQAEGFRLAIKVALDTFISTATVNGGICAPNGPVANAIIT